MNLKDRPLAKGEHVFVGSQEGRVLAIGTVCPEDVRDFLPGAEDFCPHCAQITNPAAQVKLKTGQTVTAPLTAVHPYYARNH